MVRTRTESRSFGLVWAFRITLVVIGAAGATAAALSQSMNADGINYLDIGNALFNGDWPTAINGVWSPLYGFILGAAQALVNPPLQAEFPLVHAVNFLIFVLTIPCFEYFWRRLGESCYGDDASDRLLPEPMFVAIGYLLFAWSSFTLIEIWSVTPDMCVAAFVFLAAGILLRIRRGEAGMATYMAFGASLGLGYLAKAVMFPLGWMFLGLGLLVRRCRLGSGLLISAVAFVVVSSLLMVPLSVMSGRLTWGAVGSYTYLKHVLGLPGPHFDPADFSAYGEPIHPLRRLTEDPTVFEFATPVAGTHPPSFDPFFWCEGLEVRLDLGKQLTVLAVNLEFYYDLLARRLAGITGVLLVLLIASARRPYSKWLLAGSWEVVLAGLGALSLYSIVHVTGRYIAPFVVLIAGGLLSLVDVPRERTPRLVRVAAAVIAVALAVHLISFHLEGLNAIVRLVPAPEATASFGESRVGTGRPDKTALALRDVGLREGDAVGVIGYGFDAYWARLARLKIVAELTPDDSMKFWNGGPEKEREVLEAFERAGAVAIVAEHIPLATVPEGWQELAGTGRYLYRFTHPTGSGERDQSFVRSY